MSRSPSSRRQTVIENTRISRRWLLLGAASAAGLALIDRSVRVTTSRS